MSKTGAINSVTATVFDFRGYDTLGEAIVLFTAICGVSSCFKSRKERQRRKNNNERKRRDSILISCTNLVLPILLTLGLYIIIHGHLSPGGGFQGGVLIAGAIAIIYIGYGFKSVKKGIASKYI